jgi:hypothetical protein
MFELEFGLANKLDGGVGAHRSGNKVIACDLVRVPEFGNGLAYFFNLQQEGLNGKEEFSFGFRFVMLYSNWSNDRARNLSWSFSLMCMV